MCCLLPVWPPSADGPAGRMASPRSTLSWEPDIQHDASVKALHTSPVHIELLPASLPGSFQDTQLLWELLGAVQPADSQGMAVSLARMLSTAALVQDL